MTMAAACGKVIEPVPSAISAIAPPATTEQSQHHAHKNDRLNQRIELQLEPEQRDEPASYGSTNIRTKNDAKRLRKGQQAGANKADGRNRGCTGRLNNRCCQRTGRDADRRGCRKASEKPADRIACHRAQAFSQDDNPD